MQISQPVENRLPATMMQSHPCGSFISVMKIKNSMHMESSTTVSMEKSRFTEMLIAENPLFQSGFERWIFCRGMLFKSPDKWWGDHGRRDFPHEGIDLCLYQDGSGRINRIDEKTGIPAMYAGEVRAMFKDFLGKTVIIEHENAAGGTGRFISFYAHTKPHAGIDVGVSVKKGDIIATLADTANSKSNIIPHLHFSFGRPTESFPYDGFVWDIIRMPAMITLLDPLPLIDWNYQALPAGTSACCEL